MATKNKEKSDVLETARKRFKLSEEAESEIRKLALEDLKFRAGDQWPESVKHERDLDDRPCLTINRIPQFVRQVTNDQRQNRPSIKVHPVDDKGDIETAKIYQGLIRHIENNSGADVAYDTAFEGAVVKGFGYFRVNTAYVDATAFEQEIRIEPIHDDFGVRLDPFSKLPDGSDANWALVFEDVPKEDYIAEYGESKLSGYSSWESLGDISAGWVSQSSCRVAEYFYKEFKNVDLVQLSTGQSIDKLEIEKLYPEGIPDGLVENERKAKVPVIKWVKTNGIEILEETEWPGLWIPIIPVYGDILRVDGKKILEGIVRHAKDAQRMLNYWKSTETETIALAPRSPYVVAEGQITPEYKTEWSLANRKSYSYLTYKPTTLAGQPVSPPQRQTFEPPVMAITNAALHAAEDLKATTGIYDSALGQKSNETSGRAILSRQAQAQTSNFHFIDNLTRSIRHCGRIVVDLIPKIYDTARAARIIGEEGEEEIVTLNQEFDRNGQKVHYKLGVGKYDVVVETGPSFATKRQEAAQSMIEIAKANPQIMQVAGDLFVKNLDIPGAQEISERLKKTLPPGIADDKDKPQVPPEVQAQMAQMNQMVEALTQQLNQANEQIKTKSLELETKKQIEAMKDETKLLIEVMKQSQASAMFQVEQQLRELQAAQQTQSLSPDQAPNQPPTGGFSPGNHMEGQ